MTSNRISRFTHGSQGHPRSGQVQGGLETPETSEAVVQDDDDSNNETAPSPSNSTTSSSSHPPPARQPHQTSKEPVIVVAIPSVTVRYNRLIVGDPSTSSIRSYTPPEVTDDGSSPSTALTPYLPNRHPHLEPGQIPRPSRSSTPRANARPKTVHHSPPIID